MPYQEYSSPLKLITSRKFFKNISVIQTEITEALFPSGSAGTTAENEDGSPIEVYLPTDFEGVLPTGTKVVAVKDQDENYIVIHPQICAIEGVLDNDIPAYTGTGSPPSGLLSVFLTTPQVQTLSLPYGATGHFGTVSGGGLEPDQPSGFRISYKKMIFPPDRPNPSVAQAVFNLNTTASQIQAYFDQSANDAIAIAQQAVTDAIASISNVSPLVNTAINDVASGENTRLTSYNSVFALNSSGARTAGLTALSSLDACLQDITDATNFCTSSVNKANDCVNSATSNPSLAATYATQANAFAGTAAEKMATALVRFNSAVAKAYQAVSLATSGELPAIQTVSNTLIVVQTALTSGQNATNAAHSAASDSSNVLSTAQDVEEATIHVVVSGGPLGLDNPSSNPLVFTFTESNLFLLGFVLVGDLESIPKGGVGNPNGSAKRVLPMIFDKSWSLSQYKISVQNLDPTRWLSKGDYCVCLKGQNGWVVSWAPYHV